jgi:hypothetical protein
LSASTSLDASTLLSARAVRGAADRALAAARAGTLLHLLLDATKFEAVASAIADETRRNYPDLRVPYHSRWRHFETGGIDRLGAVAARLPGDPAERCRAKIGLATLSVLLDAGAGPTWRYREPSTAQIHGRSEGLAIASLDFVMSGALSRTDGQPWRIETAPLAFVEDAEIAKAFQVGPDNPMVGLEGRARLIRSAGDVLWNVGLGQLGAVRDRIVERAQGKTIAAPAILETLLRLFNAIWPGRLKADGLNLGDTWRHPTLGLVPFHKLSQWLSYSLVEPLEEEGFEVVELDGLTGLPEYRNGGLLIDLGLIRPKAGAWPDEALAVDHPLVVEWRALTVAALDRLAPMVRERLALDARRFPLAAMLQGGSWSAGRRIARELRADGAPPLRVVSDGTVF